MYRNKMKYEDFYDENDQKMLENCTLCPRECKINRFLDGNGYCGMDAGLNISSICIHRGEEPVISGPNGICNIFFAGCNMHCIYCQNHEISRQGTVIRNSFSELEQVLDRIEDILLKGITTVGFVSPSHVVPQVRAIIRGLHSRGLRPTFVYNTNSYDKASTLASLSELIDVYLPDFKYVSKDLASEFSDTGDYPEVALKAIKMMYYQKGSSLQVDDNGNAVNGLLIRHLVLPGHAGESIKVLKFISEELSPGVHLSLMSQYYPTWQVKQHPDLGRPVYREEYEAVVNAMETLGFRNGYIQDIESHQNYQPDFNKEHPFE
jgi:putative pyruvate formate lyase activating enzyme